MILAVKLLREGAKLPTRAHADDAGADLYAHLDAPLIVWPGKARKVPTGVAVVIPYGYVGLITTRSSARLNGWSVSAVIDAGYRGEVYLSVRNDCEHPQELAPFARIAQLLVMPAPALPIVEVDELGQTERGTGGFGSTGGLTMATGIRVAPDSSAVLIEAEAGNGVVKLKVTAQYARELAAKLTASANVAEGKRADGKGVAELLQEAMGRKPGNPFGGLF